MFDLLFSEGVIIWDGDTPILSEDSSDDDSDSNS